MNSNENIPMIGSSIEYIHRPVRIDRYDAQTQRAFADFHDYSQGPPTAEYVHQLSNLINMNRTAQRPLRTIRNHYARTVGRIPVPFNPRF